MKNKNSSDYKQYYEDSITFNVEGNYLTQFTLDRKYHDDVSDKDWDNIVESIYEEFQGIGCENNVWELFHKWIIENTELENGDRIR